MNLFRQRRPAAAVLLACLTCGLASADALAQENGSGCIAALTYLPLDARDVGQDDNGVAALGTYERISPDGRFILRSHSGARLGQVSLMELPANGVAGVKVYRTPFSNEAFPVQRTWRYLVDVNGEHYRFADVLRQQGMARPLFKAGMTGFYAAAAELDTGHATPASSSPGAAVFIRSLSWPQSTSPDSQGIGPLQMDTVEIHDDGRTARVARSTGPRFICAGRTPTDGNIYALPMLSVDGTEFSAIPQIPRTGQPTMRVYGLHPDAQATDHPCELRADLGFSPGKAVFGFPQTQASSPAWLTYSDLGSVYIFDRALNQTFRLDHARHRVLTSAFPGLTRDGRVIYGATWKECQSGANCPEQAGYVVADPYQSQAYRAHWQAQGKAPPKACITVNEVQAERTRFARMHGLAP